MGLRITLFIQLAFDKNTPILRRFIFVAQEKSLSACLVMIVE